MLKHMEREKQSEKSSKKEHQGPKGNEMKARDTWDRKRWTQTEQGRKRQKKINLLREGQREANREKRKRQSPRSINL